MAWIILIVAGFFEIAWAVGMKYTQGFTRLWPSVFTIFAMVMSVVLLYWAVVRLPLGTAYAVWTGIGAAGTALLGILLFNESTSAARLACVGLVILGVIGLKLTHHESNANAQRSARPDPPGPSGQTTDPRS